MRCDRCGGRFYQDFHGELTCWACGERRYDRLLLFADRLADVILDQIARDMARSWVQAWNREHPERAHKRWDSPQVAVA